MENGAAIQICNYGNAGLFYDPEQAFFEYKYKYNVYNIEEMHMSKNLCVTLYAM